MVTGCCYLGPSTAHGSVLGRAGAGASDGPNGVFSGSANGGVSGGVGGGVSGVCREVETAFGLLLCMVLGLGPASSTLKGQISARPHSIPLRKKGEDASLSPLPFQSKSIHSRQVFRTSDAAQKYIFK